jgi:hypothetical protein
MLGLDGALGHTSWLRHVSYGNECFFQYRYIPQSLGKTTSSTVYADTECSISPTITLWSTPDVLNLHSAQVREA